MSSIDRIYNRNLRTIVNKPEPLIQFPLVVVALLTTILACNSTASPPRGVDGGDASQAGESPAVDANDESADVSSGADAEPLDSGDMDGVPSDDGGPSMDAEDGIDVDQPSLCDKVCAQMHAMACPLVPPDCEATCQIVLGGRCGAPWRSLFTCSVGHPLSDFECSPDGDLVGKPGVCTDEKMLAEACLAGDSGPPP
jgi:hypothetical protein